MANKKSPKLAHTPKSQKGLGDYYGSGIRGKLGIIRDGMGQVQISSKKLKKAPRSLA